MNIVGTVEEIGTKNVNTRYGSKPTFSAKVGGQWFKFGFKNPGLVFGDYVSAEYTPGQYGNEVSTFAKGVAPATSPVAVSGTVVNVASQAAAKSYRNGSFPIDALDGQRSIVRQNALTNARELFVALHGNKPFAVEDEQLDLILHFAKRFESYTAGDMDMEMAKASLEAEGATKQ